MASMIFAISWSMNLGPDIGFAARGLQAPVFGGPLIPFWSWPATSVMSEKCCCWTMARLDMADSVLQGGTGVWEVVCEGRGGGDLFIYITSFELEAPACGNLKEALQKIERGAFPFPSRPDGRLITQRPAPWTQPGGRICREELE